MGARKKVLIRGGVSPFEIVSAETFLTNNIMGGNIGNLVYAYSIYRTLMAENIEIIPDRYQIDHNDAAKISETYDYYVLPLADAFRESFISELDAYAKLINKLKIPVFVIGVGLRADFEADLKTPFPFDKSVRKFVSAVLEKSECIGVRGEITSAYLSKLGFSEGKDHVSIGCPSMYAFGRNLNIKEVILNKESKICVNNSKLVTNKSIFDFINNNLMEYSNHCFIPQWKSELGLTYLGRNLADPTDAYPSTKHNKIYKEAKVRFPLNVPSWMQYVKQSDFCFGTRLHGNIVPTISGVPSLTISKDARMRELVELHGLAHVPYHEINKDTRLIDLVEKTDFQTPVKKQGKNFDNYVDFLNLNNLENIYSNSRQTSETPFDKKIAQVNHLPMVSPVSTCNSYEVSERWDNYFNCYIKEKKDTLNSVIAIRKKIRRPWKNRKEIYKGIKALRDVMTYRFLRTF